MAKNKYLLTTKDDERGNGNLTSASALASGLLSGLSAATKGINSVSNADNTSGLLSSGTSATSSGLSNKNANNTSLGALTSGTSALLAGLNKINSNSGGQTESSGFTYSPYQESADVTAAKNALTSYVANRPADWTGGTYGKALNDAVNKILNRGAFSYDLNADALYQQYKDQYLNAGRMAMSDTMGQASSMTGGYGNSYAATAGNQAYQGYAQQLNNVIPDLYQLAYSIYNQEGQNLLNNYSTVADAYNAEYGQYRDSVNDWYTEAQRLANAYDSAYSIDYGKYVDDYNRQLNAYNTNATYDKTAADAALKNLQDQYENDTTDYQAQIDDLNEQLRVNKLKEQYANNQDVIDFNASIMQPREFARHRSNGVFEVTVGGEKKKFDTYEDYVDAVLEKWAKEKDMSPGQIAYLKGQYGIGTN